MKINQEISANEVLLIDEEGKPQGKVSLDQAMFLAYEKGYDLVLINGIANPPICKLMDYGKYLYAQEKQVAKQKAKAHGPELKEIRLSIKIDKHDLDFKTNQIKKFLSRGDKVKISIQLKGREMMFARKVPELIEKVKKDSDATLEKPLERMGNRFFVTLTKGKNSQA